MLLVWEKDIEALKREANDEACLTGDFKIELLAEKYFNRDVIGRHENHLFIVYKIYSDQEPVKMKNLKVTNILPKKK